MVCSPSRGALRCKVRQSSVYAKFCNNDAVNIDHVMYGLVAAMVHTWHGIGLLALYGIGLLCTIQQKKRPLYQAWLNRLCTPLRGNCSGSEGQAPYQ